MNRKMTTVAIVLIVTAFSSLAYTPRVQAQDTDSTQWCAVAETYLAATTGAPDPASLARSEALADYCRTIPVSYAAGEEARAARWQAQGKAYLAERAEKAATASGARFAALAEYYGANPGTYAAGEEARAARWQAQGEAHLAERAENAAQASSERFAALAEYYARRAAVTGTGLDRSDFLADNPEMITVRNFETQKTFGYDTLQFLCCVDTSDQQ